MKYQTHQTEGTIYLIHFDEKLCHAQHYIGFTTNLDKRLELHRKSRGAKIIAAINQLGLPWRLARTWEKRPKAFERELKNCKNAKQLCPICSGEAALNRKK